MLFFLSSFKASSSFHDGAAPIKSVNNLKLGAEEDDSPTSTDEPNYFPPSHWSTEFSARSTTPAPTKREESGTAVSGFVKQVFYKTTYNGRNKLSNDGDQPPKKGLDLNNVRRFGKVLPLRSYLTPS